MTDRQIVQDYRLNVINLHSVNELIAWNQRHDVPLLTLPDQARELKQYVLRFEDILSAIQNRRTRILLRCRYALKMTVSDIAAFMGLSDYHVMRITNLALTELDRTTAS